MFPTFISPTKKYMINRGVTNHENYFLTRNSLRRARSCESRLIISRAVTEPTELKKEAKHSIVFIRFIMMRRDAKYTEYVTAEANAYNNE